MSAIPEIKFSDFTLCSEEKGIKIFKTQDNCYRLYTLPESKNSLDFCIHISRVYFHQIQFLVEALMPNIQKLETVVKATNAMEKFTGLSSGPLNELVQFTIKKIAKDKVLPNQILQLRTDLAKALDQIAKQNTLLPEDFKIAAERKLLFSRGIQFIPLGEPNHKITPIFEKCNEIFAQEFHTFLQSYKE